MSQNQMILNHLKKGKTITPYDALVDYGCMRLAARVSDLRAKGHDIETINNGKKFAEYKLKMAS